MVNKYGNKFAGEDGKPYDSTRHKMKFASIAEAKRYGELKLLERAGQITALRCQPRYPLVVNGKTVCTYVADFEYREYLPANMPSDVKWGLSALGPVEVVEEVKGCATAAWKLKEKLFRTLHPTIDLRVISKTSSGRASSKTRALPRRVSVSKPVASSLPT